MYLYIAIFLSLILFYVGSDIFRTQEKKTLGLILILAGTLVCVGSIALTVIFYPK